MWAKVKNFIIRLFRRTQLPSTMIMSNVPMHMKDTVQATLQRADKQGLLQEPSLFMRFKRFFCSFFK